MVDPVGLAPTTPSLTAKQQTSSPPARQFDRRGMGENGVQPRHRKVFPPGPASRRPSRGRLHGTMHALAGVEPAFSGHEVSALFTTDSSDSGGTFRRGCFPRSTPRLHHPELKFSSFPLQRPRRGWKRKTPPERWLGRGSGNEHSETTVRPFHLREKERARRRTGFETRLRFAATG